ncbi:MAG: hypothetical protein ACLP7A_05330 [Desulfobaccales bacterium]
MRALSSSDFLHLWERGSRLHPLDQALLALGAALPEVPSQVLADWPLGRRNAALAELLRICFGAALRSWVACPQCRERLEFELDAQLLASGDAADQQPVMVKGREFRLPSSRDLAAIAHESDPRRASLRLLQICSADTVDAADWPEAELDEVGEQLAQADPLAETRLTLRCTTCGHAWEEPLDLGSYVWMEIEARARRLLWEIHALASAYGWSEAEILGLSEQRRTLYLEMVQA